VNLSYHRDNHMDEMYSLKTGGSQLASSGRFGAFYVLWMRILKRVQKGTISTKMLQTNLRNQHHALHWTFEKHCRELEAFKEEFGHCNVPFLESVQAIHHWVNSAET